jgi:hypothetical protein
VYTFRNLIENLFISVGLNKDWKLKKDGGQRLLAYPTREIVTPASYANSRALWLP